MRLRRLGLKQERRKILSGEGVLHGADNLAARFGDQRRGVAFKRLTEGVIRRDEEPGIAATLDHGGAGAVRQRPGVIGPMNRVRRALAAGQVRGAAAGIDEHLVLVARDGVNRECDRRGRHVEDRIHAILIVPLPGDAGADIGLVLMVGCNDLDLDALLGGLEVFDCHAGRNDRPLSGQIGVDAAPVVQDAELDRDLRMGCGHHGQRQGSTYDECSLHCCGSSLFLEDGQDRPKVSTMDRGQAPKKCSVVYTVAPGDADCCCAATKGIHLHLPQRNLCIQCVRKRCAMAGQWNGMSVR